MEEKMDRQGKREGRERGNRTGNGNEERGKTIKGEREKVERKKKQKGI